VAGNRRCRFLGHFDSHGNPKKPTVHRLMSPIVLHPTDTGDKFIGIPVKEDM
jgi:hypothetical protein